MDDLILIRQRDTLFEIILNRPGKRNAINLEMFRAFDAAVTQANRTPGLRAVLIRGEGESFVSPASGVIQRACLACDFSRFLQ